MAARAVLVGLGLALAAACSDYEYSHVRNSELYRQGGEDAAADVLFVLDDSASMDEEQARLALNFGSFVVALEETFADYRIGVTTTDPSRGGALLGPVLTPDTADLEASFFSQVDVGTDGSRDEQGLEAARLALLPDVNPELRRDEARLNVVIFSDEDDHSPDKVANYTSHMNTLAGEAGFALHAIVGDVPAGCANGLSAADAGARYIEAAEESGGYIDSICAEDYSEMLTRIGLDVAELEDTFYLTRLPRPETLEVFVDGVRMPEREQDGWQYGVGDNAVVFSGSAVPRPGMQVKVQYDVQAGHVGDTASATEGAGTEESG